MPSSGGRNASDLVALSCVLREPELVDATGCDAIRPTLASWDRELGGDPTRGNPPDFAHTPLGEPEVPIGTGRDAEWFAAASGDRELGDLARDRQDRWGGDQSTQAEQGQ